MSERKARDEDYLRDLEEQVRLVRQMQDINARLQSMMGSDGSYSAITEALDRALDNLTFLRQDARQYSDTRPLDAKTIPGAHGAYR